MIICFFLLVGLSLTDSSADTRLQKIHNKEDTRRPELWGFCAVPYADYPQGKNLGQKESSSVHKCIEDCMDTPKCDIATFDNHKVCTMRQAGGEIVNKGNQVSVDMACIRLVNDIENKYSCLEKGTGKGAFDYAEFRDNDIRQCQMACQRDARCIKATVTMDNGMSLNESLSNLDVIVTGCFLFDVISADEWTKFSISFDKRPDCKRVDTPVVLLLTDPYIPTEGVLPTVAPFYTDKDIRENKKPEFESGSTPGVKTWAGKLKEPVPYTVLKNISKSGNPANSPLGFLAYAGYIDYSLDGSWEKEETRPVNKPRVLVNQDNLDNAVDSFLRFNGYPEGEKISEEIFEGYMQNSRCDNADIEYTGVKDKNCITRKGDGIKRIVDKSLMKGKPHLLLPPDNEDVSEQVSYYFEVDVKFKSIRKKRTRAIFVGYNYNRTGDGSMEFVALRFLNNTLCAQFGMLVGGAQIQMIPASRETIMNSCYTPTKTELKVRFFKVRLDVISEHQRAPGRVYVTVKGEDVASNVIRSPGTISSVILFYYGSSDHIFTTTRICTRPQLPNRTKRFQLSVHMWHTEDDTITFNFQNYSSLLGQESTRQAVLRAVELHSTATQLIFKEVHRNSPSKIAFMFIKGNHADGLSFDGPGIKKAHAYSPVHSEIHFNDYEVFSLDPQEKYSTSLFYVAAHEMGHSLGLKHSEKRSAVMHADYPENAFEVTGFHDDDKIALSFLYHGARGRLDSLDKQEVEDSISGYAAYRPKTPFPKECHSKIDAALNLNGYNYLISDAFLWKYDAETIDMLDGYPKRTSDVFPALTGTIDAMFYVSNKDGVPKVHIIRGNVITVYEGTDDNFELVSSKLLSDFMEDGDTRVDQEIKSAFSWGEKTILITKDGGYYEVEWKVKKEVKPTSITLHNDATDILGRKVENVDFNAAMEYKRTFSNPSKTAHMEVLNFGKNLLKSELAFGEAKRTVAWTKVEDYFKISGWCPPESA